MRHDTYYEWDAPVLVRLEWTEDGAATARLVVTCADGSEDVIDVVAVSRGRLLPAVVDVVVQEEAP